MRVALLGSCVALVLLLAVSSFAQWQFAYEKEKDIAFYSVHFPTSTVGYAVGSGGVIYKSTNSGDTWTEQTSPVSLTLFDVFFLDANNGWAVGDNGVMIKTTDGTNWVEHDSSGVMTTRDLNVVQFIGNKGWIGGDVATLFLTNDGGVSWSPPTTVPLADDCNDLVMVSTSVGYAAMDSDLLMYTEDGGDNWTTSAVNLGPYPYTRDDIEVIIALNDTNGIAAGWGSLVGPQPTIILVTQDAGKTWNTPDPTYHWDTYGYGYGLAKFDDGEALLTGGGSGSAAFLLHSTDNGNNWVDSPAFGGEDSRAACAVPGTNRVVVVGDEGMFALSTDRGQTWSFTYGPGTGFAGWHGIEHRASDMIMLCGANGHFIKLMQDDTGIPTGAYDFSAVSPENWAPTILHDLSYLEVMPNAQGAQLNGYHVLYVCGSNQYLCKSNDMGATWTQLQHAPSATSAIYKMWWFDSNNGFLVGEITSQETIWRTSDGGVTITPVWYDSTATSLQFNSISFAPDDPLVGVVCGDDTSLVYTNDGGTTWNWAYTGVSGSKPDLEEVHMVSATDGWIVGDAGTVLKTTDGGANWVVQANPSTTKNLMDVHFRGPDQPGYGWICGDDQTFFYTDDGGATWNPANPTLDPTTKDINCVHFQNPACVLWIGVDDADVLYRVRDAVTAVETPVSLPYVLGQNYPNPFNPTTTIEFSLPTDDNVTLNVYDVSGRLVATVLNKSMEAGDHTVRFDARGLASGVYFYRLSTSNRVETKKMVLLR